MVIDEQLESASAKTLSEVGRARRESGTLQKLSWRLTYFRSVGMTLNNVDSSRSQLIPQDSPRP